MIAELYGKYKEEWKLLPYISASYSSGLDTSQELRIIMPVGSDIPTMAKIGNFLAVTIDNIERNSNSITIAGHAINANSLENEQYSDLIGNNIAEVCSLLADKAGIFIIGADSTPIESAGLLDNTAIATVSTIAQILKASSIYIDSTLEKDRIRIGTPWVGGKQAYVMEWSEVINKKTYDACLCTKTAPIAERVQMVLAKKKPKTNNLYNEENPPQCITTIENEPAGWEKINIDSQQQRRFFDANSASGQFGWFGTVPIELDIPINRDQNFSFSMTWLENGEEAKAVFVAGFPSVHFIGYLYGAPLIDKFKLKNPESYKLPANLRFIQKGAVINATPSVASITQALNSGVDVPTITNEETKAIFEGLFLTNSRSFPLQGIPSEVEIRPNLGLLNLQLTNTTLSADYIENAFFDAVSNVWNYKKTFSKLPNDNDDINVGKACPYWYLLAKIENSGPCSSSLQGGINSLRTYTIYKNNEFNPNEIYFESDERFKFNGPYKDMAGSKRFSGSWDVAQCKNIWQNIPTFKGGYTYDELTLLNATFGSSIIAQGMFGSQIIDLSSSNTTTSLTPAQGSTPKIVKAITPQAETYEWGNTGVNTLAISSPLWKHREQRTAQELLDFANLKNGTRTLKYKCHIPEGWEWDDLFKVEINGLRPVEMVVYFELNTVEYTLKAKE